MRKLRRCGSFIMQPPRGSGGPVTINGRQYPGVVALTYLCSFVPRMKGDDHIHMHHLSGWLLSWFR